ncbi:hypothetical protein MANES_13G105340v8 [Manihot esculenta]|uniref:Uncharacterized protein n=1 Tax=Manihot esculenta TaxID=3983 RepID=A0ACB7GLD9_MANES|nr:hypothetical protein MANES_13G105340v8 [Manihot esculenta]
MAVMSFLVGLPPKFETAKSQILSNSEISSLHEVFTRILLTESSSPVLSHTTSVFVSRNDSGRQNNGDGNRGAFNGSRGSQHPEEAVPTFDSGGIICYYYHEPEHTKKTCLKLQNNNQCSQMAHMAVEASPDQRILIVADVYVQFSQYQASMNIAK